MDAAAKARDFRRRFRAAAGGMVITGESYAWIVVKQKANAGILRCAQNDEQRRKLNDKQGREIRATSKEGR
jgi:uncharacterized protein YegP (UPF0339 family)